MPKILSFPESPDKTDHAPIDAGRQSVIDAIKVLFRGLPPEAQERALAEITEAIRPIAAPRAGDVLGAIIKFLPRRPHWTIGEIKEQVAASGIQATDKEVYNSVGYLTRKRHIQRVGYGRYLIDGVGLTTAEDLGVEPWRDECE